MASRRREREAHQQEDLHDDKEAKEHMHMTPSGDEESKEETHSITSEREEFRPCIHSGVFAGIGDRPSMEDAHVVIDDVGQFVKMTSVPTSFYAVFDGHYRQHAAEFARSHLFLIFLNYMHKFKDIASALECAFHDTDNQFKDAWLENKELASGTTALAAVIAGSKLYVANAGDCRAVICRKGNALDMSTDHDPRKNVDEHKRIIEAGGFLDEGYLNGQINMSRGIGNWHYEGLKGPGPFISTPEIKFEELTEEDEFMIVASDGLFKTCSSQYAVNFVRGELEKHNDLEKCARDLAHSIWHGERRANFLADNSTVVIVSFRRER